MGINSKKSWHPTSGKNLKRVANREQQVLEEQRKVTQLQRELDEQWQTEELNRMQNETSGANSGSRGQRPERLDWMYTRQPEPSSSSVSSSSGIASRQSQTRLSNSHFTTTARNESSPRIPATSSTSATSSVSMSKGANKVLSQIGVLSDSFHIGSSSATPEPTVVSEPRQTSASSTSSKEPSLAELHQQRMKEDRNYGHRQQQSQERYQRMHQSSASMNGTDAKYADDGVTTRDTVSKARDDPLRSNNLPTARSHGGPSSTSADLLDAMLADPKKAAKLEKAMAKLNKQRAKSGTLDASSISKRGDRI
ncbi:hypothetical protein GQ42DRAFT_23444 [Ramicandelaber brevisporus]|nr:hypothetical protein GQ42DRAFT_23444 [Ramicandelaber brevisporus]